MLCRDHDFVRSVLHVSREIDNPIHSKCLEILCNLSRFPANAPALMSYAGLVDTILFASNSKLLPNRLMALRMLQNLSADASCKTVLATDAVLTLMTSSAMRRDAEEKEAAVATLYNITTEPGAVVAITNTKNVVATLVHLAHNPESSPQIRLMACESLATISLWLQTLAGTGKVPAGVEAILPSHKTSGWERWQ